MEVILLFIAIPIAFVVFSKDYKTIKEEPESEEAEKTRHILVWTVIIFALIIIFASL